MQKQNYKVKIGKDVENKNVDYVNKNCFFFFFFWEKRGGVGEFSENFSYI